jgi:hypothetical protein
MGWDFISDYPYYETDFQCYEKKKEFFDKVLPHNLIKEVLCVLLQLSGYTVLPYGYEMTLSGLAQEFKHISKTRTGTIKRIRNSPDLLVYDSKTEELMLVEVKVRNAPNEKSVPIKKGAIEPYQKYWKDAYFLIAIPVGGIFYAIKISELDSKKSILMQQKTSREFMIYLIKFTLKI